MKEVKAKKHLGQHFLTDHSIAKKIADAMTLTSYKKLIEIGPGMGVLTQFLVKNPQYELSVVEIDDESVVYLQAHYPTLKNHIINADFLQLDLEKTMGNNFGIVGNFPYNISTQILFKTLENRNFIPEFAGMFQKEVAQRIASKEGSKDYGILSVLLQAYYHIDYLFTVSETVFNPPPKVQSGVIRMERYRTSLPCSDDLFKTIVKTSFNQRRKTLRNSLKALLSGVEFEHHFITKRPEQLSPTDFIELTQAIETAQTKNLG